MALVTGCKRSGLQPRRSMLFQGPHQMKHTFRKKKQQTNTVLSPETETIKKTEADILMKAKREYSQKPEAGMVKIERITKSDQPIQKKEEKELREKEGSQKMHNTYKVHKAQKMDGAKKMKIIQNSAIEHKK